MGETARPRRSAAGRVVQGGEAEAVSIPSDFVEMLAGVFAPGEVEPAAAALEEALQLDDAQLAGFLERLAERIRYSPEPLTAGELVRLAELESPDAGSPPLPG